MILYHGSHEIVEKPIYGLGEENNDYGRGFYCTEDPELAMEWACPKAKDGFSNQYEMDMTNLRILHLNREPHHIMNWIALLLQNRTFPTRLPIAKEAKEYVLREFLPDTKGYDVIIGYRADDSYFAFANDFINNGLTVRQLARAMELGDLGEQIVLKSKKAFSRIRFLSYEIADKDIYYHRRTERESEARNTYLSDHGASFPTTEQDLFVRDMIRQEIKNDDPRLS